MFDVEDKHFWYKGMRLISQSILSRYLKNKDNYILDAGCGTGGNFSFLNQFGTVVGIDVSPIAVKLAKKKGITNIKKASVGQIPYSDNSFDLITCFDVLGHKQVNEEKALVEFHRVLKPGGLIMIRVAAYKWLYSYHDIEVQNSRRYTKSKLIKLLKRKNFLPIKKTYANTILFPIIGIKRLFLKLFNIKSLDSDVQPVNKILNYLLFIAFIIENFIIKFINLSFGTSIIILARKK